MAIPTNATGAVNPDDVPAQAPASVLPPIWRHNDPWEAYNEERGQLPPGLPVNPAEPVKPESYSWLDTGAAAARQSGNVVTAAYQHFTEGSLPAPQQGYNAYIHDTDFVKANPDMIPLLMGSQSPAETRLLTSRKRQDDRDRDVLSKSGVLGTAATLGFSITDPLTLASFAIPLTMEVGLGRIGSIIAGAGAQAAVQGLKEGVNMPLHPETTLTDAMASVTGAALGAGVFGHLVTGGVASKLTGGLIAGATQGVATAGQQLIDKAEHPEHQVSGGSIAWSAILAAGMGSLVTRVPSRAIDALSEQAGKEWTSAQASAKVAAANPQPQQLDLLTGLQSTQLAGSLAARREAAIEPEKLLSQQRSIQNRLDQIRPTAENNIPEPIQPPTPKEAEALTSRKAELELSIGDLHRVYGIRPGTKLDVRTDISGTERGVNLLTAQSEHARMSTELEQVNQKLAPINDQSPEALMGREQRLLLDLADVNKGFDVKPGQTLDEHIAAVRGRRVSLESAEQQAKLEATVQESDKIHAQLAEVRTTLTKYQSIAAAKTQQDGLNAQLVQIERQLADRPGAIAGTDTGAKALLEHEQTLRAALADLPKRYGLPEGVSIEDQAKGLPLAKNKAQAESQMAVLSARGEQTQLRQHLADVNAKLEAHGYKGAKPHTGEEPALSKPANAMTQQDLFSLSEAPYPESIWRQEPQITKELEGPANLMYPKGAEPISAMEDVPAAAQGLGADSFGAARVAGQSAEDRSLALGGKWLAKSMSFVSPALRVLMRGSSPKAMELAAKLVEIGAVTKGETKGIATAPSLERLVRHATDKALVETNAILDSEYLAHRKTGGQLSRGELGEEAFKAMNQKDTSPILAAQKIARRTRVIMDKTLEDLKARGILSEDFEFKGANESYAPYVFNQQKIIENRGAWEKTVFNFFKKNPKLGEGGEPISLSDAEIMTAEHETTNKVLGTLRGMPATGAVRAARSTKQRTLDMPYSVAKDFLVHDYESVMKGYFRQVLPQIENAKMFELGFDSELKDVDDEYGLLSRQATTDAEKETLRQQHMANREDLIGLHKRAMMQAGPVGDQNRKWVTALKTARTFAFVKDLGGMAVSSTADVGRVMMQHGVPRTIATLARYLSSSELRAVAKADARRMGTALDWILHTRGPDLKDIGDSVESTWGQKILGTTGRLFTRASGVATWNDAWKSMTTILEQDALVRAVQNPESLNDFQRGNFANIGFGTDELRRAKAQIDQFARQEQGVWRLRTDAWSDKGLAERFANGVSKRADILVQTTGAADLPFMMDSNLGKTVLQFQSFGIGAVHRIMIPAAQGLAGDTLRTANGIAMMLAIGAYQYVIKEKLAGREADLSHQRLAMEAVNRSGIIGWIPNLLDPVNGLLHGQDYGVPQFQPYGQAKGLSDFLGPTSSNISNVMQSVTRATAKSHKLDQKDLDAVFKMMPFKSLPGMARTLHAVDGELGEAFNLPGSTNQTFGQRFTETKPLVQK